jgi:hypothetical protein
MKRTYSREELHELVWSTPMQKLAADFGLSDKGLAKTCARHLIPVPPRGYWAKIEAGQKPKRTPLRAVDNTGLQTVHIGGKSATPQSEYLAQALATIRAEPRQKDEALVAPAPVDELPKSVAPPSMSTPVKLEGNVKAFVAEFRKCKPDRDGYISLRWTKVTPADVDRVGALLGRIHAELQPFGFSFDCLSSRLGFTKDGTKVDFRITAPRKQITTDSKYGWKQYELKHIGRLNLQIWGDAEGVAKNWTDTDQRRLEELVPQIVESFRINHIANGESDKRRRHAEELRLRMRHRRQLVELRQKREDDRLSFLKWIADARREVDDLRATISAVPQYGEIPADYARMIVWATQRLADLENKTTVERIQERLVELELYAEPDPFFDPEGDPAPKVNSWDD